MPGPPTGPAWNTINLTSVTNRLAEINWLNSDKRDQKENQFDRTVRLRGRYILLFIQFITNIALAVPATKYNSPCEVRDHCSGDKLEFSRSPARSLSTQGDQPKRATRSLLRLSWFILYFQYSVSPLRDHAHMQYIFPNVLPRFWGIRSILHHDMPNSEDLLIYVMLSLNLLSRSSLSLFLVISF